MYIFIYYIRVFTYMEEKRKKHFNVGEVKTQILEYILQHDVPVTEPELTDHLKNKYSEFNRASVNRHLSDLEKLECVTKVLPVNKSRFNYWDIKFKNLKSIKTKFPNIELKGFPKSLKILLEELDTEGFVDISNPMECRRFEIQLSLSDSYFSYLLNTDLKTFRENVHNLNPFGKDFLKTDRYEMLLNKVYTEFIEPISIGPGISISKEEFENILVYLIYYEKNFDYTTSIFLSNDIILRLRDKYIIEVPVDHQASKDIEKEINSIVEPILLKNRETLKEALRQLDMLKSISKKFTPDIIFQHFYERDILNGVVSTRENIFVMTTKTIMRSHEADENEQIMEELDKFYVKFLDGIKKPSQKSCK